MYESPIQMISEDIIKDIVRKQDECLMEAVHRVGFNIDKDELEKALLYDRNQWERGYVDGKMDGYNLRDTEIVRCKECKWWNEKTCSSTLTPDNRLCLANRCYWRADDFCSFGERREDAEVH